MNRLILLVHRGLGIGLCLFFAVWFLSGAILIYQPFPSLSPKDRLAGSKELDLSRVKVSPLEALSVAGLPSPTQLRLIDLDGSPLYVVHSESKVKAVRSDTALLQSPVTIDGASRIAQRFSKLSVADVEGPLDTDQWIVPNGYDSYRPFYRVTLSDSEITQLYVSQVTGEVLQRTQFSERAWNFLGAVVHWIYPTVLRKHWALWDQVVWSLSLLGILVTVTGLYMGGLRTLQARVSKRWIPQQFKSWMRWHHLLGGISGLFVLTWIFSGWLSMDHGRLFSTPNPTREQIQSFQKISMSDAVSEISVSELARLGTFKEAEFFALGGKGYVVTRTSRHSLIYGLDNERHLSKVSLSVEAISGAVQNAWKHWNVVSSHAPGVDDAYAHLREGSLPAGTIRFVLDDPDETWVHVDRESGKIVSVMDRSRRLYRWLFNGLHSLDVPGLVQNRPLWDGVILSLLAVGFAFSITGVVLGFKRLVTICSSRPSSANED